MPVAEAPTLEELRRAVWDRLPGYAWPAAVMVPALPRRPDGSLDQAALPATADGPTPPPSPEARLLAANWAEAGGDGGPGNYWQRFSFLDALAAAAGAGLPVTPQQVARCRTVEALATAVASQRERSAAAPPRPG